MKITYSLNRSTLASIDQTSDDGNVVGGLQLEGGTISDNSKQVGTYSVTRQTVTGATDLYNTAMVTITLFFPQADSQNPPEHITLQGAWQFNHGLGIGSVSATSADFAALRGRTFEMHASPGAPVPTLLSILL